LIDVFAAAWKRANHLYGGLVSKDDVRALVTTVFIQTTPKAQYRPPKKPVRSAGSAVAEKVA